MYEPQPFADVSVHVFAPQGTFRAFREISEYKYSNIVNRYFFVNIENGLMFVLNASE